jgi:5-methylcytosine-specific restriction endonuclease McrA
MTTLSAHCTTGQPHRFVGGICKRCGSILTSVVSFIPEVGRPKPRPKRRTESLRNKSRDIYDRDGARCNYCDRDLLPLSDVENRRIQNAKLPVRYPTIDHVQPLSKGGTWALHNTVVACPECNVKKANTYESGPA